MNGALKWRWMIGWTGGGLFLIWLLFQVLSVSLTDAVTALMSTPPWLLALVAGLTFTNQIIGTLKWQASARYLATPVSEPRFLRLVELTSLGAFFGQLVPVQISTLLARWFLLGRDARASGHVVRATLFEQVFDLVLVLGGTVAAVAVFVTGQSAHVAIWTFVGVVALVLISVRPIMRLGAIASRLPGSIEALENTSRKTSEAFTKASKAPASVLLVLASYSLVRLIIVGLRAVAVLWVFAPETASWLVFVASPGVGLLSAVPLTPAGLGVVEWTWSAVLIVGGTASSVAAVAALNIRLINMVALILIVAGLALLQRLIPTRRGIAEPKP